MARESRMPGEKPLFWAGSAKADLLDFPEPVKDGIGIALSVAQFGGKHPRAKPWKGEGPGVLEVVEDFRGDTFGRFTQCDLKGQSTYFMLFKKSHDAVLRQPSQILS